MRRILSGFILALVGSSALLAQLPNPLNLPDPLGLSRKPAPSTPRPKDGRRMEARPGKKEHHDNGKHKGQRKHEGHERKGRDRR